MTPEPSAARRALTGLALAVILLAAVIIQLTVVNRLPLPAAAPDLVLLAVTAIAVCTSPLAGALAGFAGGLALDVAPPVIHYAGEYALIFCLAGYAAARAVRVIWGLTGERDPVTMFTVMAVAAVAGEAGKAALGMLLSDPDVTAPVIRLVLPAAILYDLLLALPMFLLVARLTRDADPERAPVPQFSRAQRLASAFRLASAGAAPGLRLSGTGEDYRSRSVAGRVPKLRLAGARSPAIHGTGAAASAGAPLRLAGDGTPSLDFTAARQGRSARRVVLSPGKNWLRTAARPAVTRKPRRGAGLTAAAFRGTPALPAHAASAMGYPAVRRAGRTPGKNWLRQPGTGVLAAKRTPNSPARGWLRPSGTGLQAARRATRGPGRGWLKPAGLGAAAGTAGFARPRSGAEVLAARTAPSGLSAWAGAGTRFTRRRSPRSGWLRTGMPSWRPAGPRRSPRSGWLGGAGRPRTVIGSTPGGAARRSSYSAAPSRAWVRRSHSPWRKRKQRLLQMVGVGR